MIIDKCKKLLTVLSFNYKKESKLSKLAKLNFAPPLSCLIIAWLENYTQILINSTE